MTDDAAFLARILEVPDDDVPRLAWADYLDETGGEVACQECLDGDVGCSACHGAGYYYDPPYSLNRLKCPSCDEGLLPEKCKHCSGSGRVSDGRRERAEFIRVQVELVGLSEAPVGFKGCVHCDRNSDYGEGPCRYHALRRRERDLFESRAAGWVPVPDGHTLSVALVDASGRPCVNYSLSRDYVKVTGDLRLYFDRGFGGEWWGPMADFLGGPCRRCVEFPTGAAVILGTQTPRYACPACHGEGHTTGIAAALFASQPVREVRLSDREPRQASSGLGWYWVESGGPVVSALPDLPELIPSPLWAAGLGVYHPTRDAALAALSAAAVAYGRSAAGLVTPPVPPAPPPPTARRRRPAG